MVEEADVFAVGAFGGAGGTAEDAGAGDGEDEGSVESGVAVEDGLPAAGVDGIGQWVWSSLHFF